MRERLAVVISIPPELPTASIPLTLLKMPPSPSIEIVSEVLIAIAPAFPCPNVFALTVPPSVRERLAVVISIPPELPIPDSSTRLRMPLPEPITPHYQPLNFPHQEKQYQKP